MARPLAPHKDRLFPSDPTQRALARRLYAEVQGLPIISPHGHTDPQWFADNAPFGNAAALLLAPDHYLFRMLYSQGVPLESLGVAGRDGNGSADPREAWRLFARHFYLFRGTPSAMWLNYVFAELFGLETRLDESTADHYFDRIGQMLTTEAFRPRALFERFNIEVLATTESPTDDLAHHRKMRESKWRGRVITAYRPDPVVDPEHDEFAGALRRFGELSGCDDLKLDGIPRSAP